LNYKLIELNSIDPIDYMKYLEEYVFKTYDPNVEEFLADKIQGALQSTRRVRHVLRSRDVFSIKGYVLGPSIHVQTPSSLRISLRIATNPSIMITGDKVYLYIHASSIGSHPVPNPWSRTFIVLAKLPLRDFLRGGEFVVSAESILYPYITLERVEDPRIYSDNNELYHVRAIMGKERDDLFVLTFASRIGEKGFPKYIEPVRFMWVDGTEHIIREYRDTFPINNNYMVVRPVIKRRGLAGIIIAPRMSSVVNIKDLHVYSELLPTNNEFKTDLNCALRISSNEYLLFFHSVDKYYTLYHTYVAVLSNDGKLLGLLRNPAISPRIHDYHGARPGTVFLCGAVKHEDTIYVSAGKDDEIILILETSIDKLLEEVIWLKG